MPLDGADTELRVLRGEPPRPEDLIDFETERRRQPPSQNTNWPKVCGKVSLPSNVKSRSITVKAWTTADDDLSFIKNSETDAQADGSFCFEWLDPGAYIIGAVTEETGGATFRYMSYYPGVNALSQAKQLTLSKGRVEKADFQVNRQQLYSVRGYLRGVPHSREPIMVMLFSKNMDPITIVEPVVVKPNSLFDFRGVPPGNYSAFAFTADDENETMTFVSTVVEIEVQADYEGLRLEMVSKQ